MPHGITQCYLPPDRGDIPAFTACDFGAVIQATKLTCLLIVSRTCRRVCFSISENKTRMPVTAASPRVRVEPMSSYETLMSTDRYPQEQEQQRRHEVFHEPLTLLPLIQ